MGASADANMTTKVKVIFDTSEWDAEHPSWEIFRGLCDEGQAYFFIHCETIEEIKAALDNVYGLGHTAEVIYA